MQPTDVVDWRRRVFAIYAAVRDAASPEAGHAVWSRERDVLLRTHPASPVPESERAGLVGADVAPYDAAWRFECALEPADGMRWDVETGTDGVVPFERWATARLPGVGTLDVWRLRSYGGGLFVPVRDELAGRDGGTYGGGRYLIDTVKGADLGGGDGTLVLDLNFAYAPSCAYDPAWACPLPPVGNRVAVPIPVGSGIRCCGRMGWSGHDDARAAARVRGGRVTLEAVRVAAGVLVVTLPEAAMNAVLVVDGGEVLVVDVGATPSRGAELHALAERHGRVVAVVVTHPHWDHVFGLGAFADVPSHAHPATIVDLLETGIAQRDALIAFATDPVPAWLRTFVPPLPTHPVAAPTTVRVGGLDVVLDPVGHAHTVGDLALHVPAMGVSVLGDLVEVGDPPQLHDADLAGWVAALDRLAPGLQPIVVPGHGAATTPAFVAAQRDLLAAGLAHLRGAGPAPEGLDLTQLPG